jgi:hypothetical protein
MGIIEKGEIVTGTIVDVETGEKHTVSHYLLPTGFRINTVIKITNVEFYTHLDNSTQVCVDCLALDSVGSVCKLQINYCLDDEDSMREIVRDLNKKLYHYIEGEYAFSQDDHFITIHNPKYSLISEKFSLMEIEKAFTINS